MLMQSEESETKEFYYNDIKIKINQLSYFCWIYTFTYQYVQV